MDTSLAALRTLRAIAERGSFTAAAAVSGYTQSAVSRQAAALEAATGRALFERRPDGVRLTAAGHTLLRGAARALDELDRAERELTGERPRRVLVRLGAFTSAGAWLVPRVAAELRARDDVELVTQTGSTRSLVRALRAGSLDLAVLASSPPFRPLDEESPELATRTIGERELLVAAPRSHPLAGTGTVAVDDLAGQPWIASRSAGDETALGVWPGLRGRPRIVHTSPDWTVKLQLVAGGAGLTTVPHLLLPVLPGDVRALRVTGGSQERRRILLARLPGPRQPAVRDVEAVLARVAASLEGAALAPPV